VEGELLNELIRQGPTVGVLGLVVWALYNRYLEKEDQLQAALEQHVENVRNLQEQHALERQNLQDLLTKAAESRRQDSLRTLEAFTSATHILERVEGQQGALGGNLDSGLQKVTEVVDTRADEIKEIIQTTERNYESS
jgi:uncharacterized phage infection (PIP) family protein YhgE